jgi:hypothetical protein
MPLNSPAASLANTQPLSHHATVFIGLPVLTPLLIAGLLAAVQKQLGLLSTIFLSSLHFDTLHVFTTNIVNAQAK